MAEFIAHADLLNDAERIIVENYLGAKYFADLVVNDFFDWQLIHADEVIGIGRFTGATNFHNVSQGRNVFQIEGPTADFADADNEFFLVGHNDADVTNWTVTDALNLGINTQRVVREWKVDHTGEVGDVKFTVINQLSINENELENLSVYPNPVQNFAAIDYVGSYLYSIIDATGKVVKNGQENGKAEVSMEALAPGMYIIELVDGDKISRLSHIKE